MSGGQLSRGKMSIRLKSLHLDVNCKNSFQFMNFAQKCLWRGHILSGCPRDHPFSMYAIFGHFWPPLPLVRKMMSLLLYNSLYYVLNGQPPLPPNCVRTKGMVPKSEVVLAPMVTLKVLINIRLSQNVPLSSLTTLCFLNFSQKCCPGASRWSVWPSWGWPWLPCCPWRSSPTLGW